MKADFETFEIEFVMFDGENLIHASDCDFHCGENCACDGCQGVCTWDCKVVQK